jgi:hypothetical protein
MGRCILPSLYNFAHHVHVLSELVLSAMIRA